MRESSRFQRAVCSAGLTLEDGCCKYLLLEKESGAWRVGKLIMESMEDEKSESYDELFRLLSEGGAVREVPMTFALPFYDSLLKLVDLPGYTPEQARCAIRYQFEEHFPFTLDESRFSVGEISYSAHPAAQKRFIAAACRRSVVDAVAESALRNGFSLCRVEPAQLAFERALTPWGEAGDLLEIYAGARELLFIICNSGNGVFYRNAPNRARGGEYVGRVVSEARLTLEFAASRIPGLDIERIRLAGPNAGAALCEALAGDLLYHDVEIAEPFAAHGLTPRREANLSGLLSLCCLMLLISFASCLYESSLLRTVRGARAAAEATLSRVEMESAAQAAELAKIKKWREDEERKLDYLLGGVPAVGILSLLSLAAEEGVVVEELDASDGKASIRGRAGSFERLAPLSEALVSSGLFASVGAPFLVVDDRAGAGVSFVISCETLGAAAGDAP